MSNLWSGSIEADERVNAEVLWQPCHGAGPSVKAAGLSLHGSGELSQAGMDFCMLTVEIECLNGFLLRGVGDSLTRFI